MAEEINVFFFVTTIGVSFVLRLEFFMYEQYKQDTHGATACVFLYLCQ